ncbi:VOC family protein [Candidatus Nitrosocosmicus franklandus]|uniref:Glyoxalase/Bleomycin resistance protein/Dioxygenase superfamily protein n=1 Tax=Candidatus Nitrosocosmicus franklandianus TaxID=1798806 RepID=A0A484I662_9ARCH|nr:VOC family protein [Candidatus Nitrosocosmicus franklandus]VFJ12678.1 Glyoxalase/Bleomycin resistance protein/Dioxygenase superfamily protein [Candidatus Nitrosocosmicus franklandus]
MIQTKGLPQGYHSVNPYIIINKAQEFVLFLESVFGAERVKEVNENGVYYAEAKIGDSILMIEENISVITQKGTFLWIYVEDVSLIYEQAIAKGCISLEPPTLKYGVDIVAKVRDPFDLCWFVSSYNPS